MVGWRTGFFVRIWDELEKKWEYIFLEEEETLPRYIFGQTDVDGYSFGAISAGSQSDFQQVKDLDMGDKHILQVLMGCRTACLFYVQHPSGKEIGGLDQRQRATPDWREMAYYDQHTSPFEAPSWGTELFCMKNIFPAINAFNPTITGRSLSPEVNFAGKMFAYMKITQDDHSEIWKDLERRRIPSRPIRFGGISTKGLGI